MTAYTGTILKAATGGELGRQYKVTGYYTFGAEVETTDTITWADIIPASGARVIGGKVWGVELDSNATPTATFIIGDGSDTDGYLNTKGGAVGLQNSLAGQLAYFFDGALLGTTVTTNNDVVLTMTAATATGASSGTIWIELDLEAV